jgi:DNA-binding NarL/FixJ family response regulator
MKILYLEDHSFFGDSVRDILVEDYPQHQIDYVTNYANAVNIMKENKYDISILDVILQNGKTGIHFAEKFTPYLGKILFVTGCKDELTIKALEKYEYVNKDLKVISTIREFIKKNEQI